MAQIVKLRRSSVSGQKPTNTNLQLGELALNTTDGKVYMAKSGSLGPSVEELISTNTINTGSINISGSINLNGNQTITGSLIVTDGVGYIDTGLIAENSDLLLTSGSNIYVQDGGIVSASQIWGDGSNLINIPLSGITNLTLISQSFDDRLDFLETYSGSYTGSFSGSFVGDGSGLINLPVQNVNTASLATTGSNVFVGDQIITGSINITGTVDGVDISQFSSSVDARLNSVTASGGISAIYIADEGAVQGTASYFDFIGAGITAAVNNGTASITVTATGGGGSAIQGASQTYTQTTNAATWSIDHSINSRTPVVEVYDQNYNVIIPTGIFNPGAFQTLIYFDVEQRGFAIISTGGGLTVDGANAILDQASASSTWTFNHNLGTKYPVFNIFDSNDDVIIPQRINVVDENTAIIYFSSARSGKAVASVGGDVVNSDSSSFSVSSSFATNANFLDGKDSTEFAITGSNIFKGSQIITGSLNVTQGITGSIDYINLINVPSLISGSSQVLITGTTGYSTFSSSISTSIGGLSSSIATTDLNQNNRLDSLETASGSIRTDFNFFTSSYRTGSFTGSFIGDGIGLYNIPASGVTGLNLNKIISGSVSASISPNRGLEINTDVYIDGALTAKELFINYVTSSVLYESGSTKFGDTLDDTHEFTGSVNITGSISLNGQPIGTGKLDEVTFNFFTSSYTTGSFTGSFIGDGSQLTNIPASGVTGLNLNKIVSGSVSASISPNRGLEINTDTTISGSLQISGSGFLNSHRILTDLDTGSMGLINSIQFNTSSNISVKPGELAWNNSDGTLDLGMKGGAVVQQIGQVTYYEVRNDTVSVIPKGTAVYADGVTASGGRITATPYVADGSIREVRFLGLAAESISTGVNGFVTYFGYIRGLDTRGNVVSSIAVGDETWAVGDILYVHPTVAGKLTNVAPEHEIIVAIIINRHQSAGVIFVRPSSGGHLEDLHDITINTGSLTNGQVLVYNSTNGLWENTNTISGSLNVTGGLTGSIDYSNITNKPTLVSGSSQISYSGLTGIPSNIVSSSSQISAFGFLETSSFNSFTSSYNTGSFTGSFTGSLFGTASYAMFALSSPSSPGFTTNMTQSSAAATWSFVHNLNTRNPIVQVYDSSYKQIIPNEIVGVDEMTAEIRFDYSQDGYAVASNGGGLYITGSTSRINQESNATTWSFTHNLGTKYPSFEVFDSGDNVIIPAGIKATSVNSAEIYFATPTSGIAIANFSGINGFLENSLTSSFSLATNWDTIQDNPITGSLTNATSGTTTTVVSVSTGSYYGAFFDYVVISGSNSRAGTLMSTWNGSSVVFNESTTTDIGDTNQVTMSVDLSGTDVRLRSTNVDQWLVKSLIRLI
jgi:hypothetical protein